MKLLTIRFEDAADLAAFAVGAKINVSNSSSTTEGVVLAVTNMADPPEAEIVQHTHPVGPAVPTD